MIKKILTFSFLFILVNDFNAQSNDCSQLFISEYVEGWENNKALEIYNPTGTNINLAGYFITLYANGSSTATVANSVQLSGIVPAHGVFVAVLDKRDPNGVGQEVPVWDSLQARADGFYCPLFNISNAFYWTGNDAILLAKGTLPGQSTAQINSSNVTGFQIVDVFGKIGQNPADETGTASGNNGAWSTVFPHNSGLGVLVTKDHSLIRKNDILKGFTSNPSFFDPLLEYDSIPPIYIDNSATYGNWGTLGFHDCMCNSITTICDSVVLNEIFNVSACMQYVSSSNQTYTQSGTYNEVIPNMYGCDSIHRTINLTVLNSSSSFTATICDGDTYFWNGQPYSQYGQYTQTLTNQFGCDSAVILNLNVNYNDYISITSNPAFGNAPLNVAFANQTNDFSNYNFTWYFGDGTSQQSNAPFLSHTYTQDGYADVTVIANNILTGCSSSQTFNDMVFVIGGVTCTHTATINQSGPLSGCAGDSILLSCNTDATFTYQWNRNGVPVSGATTSSFYPSQSGSYSVTIYQNNCPVTSAGISVTMNALPSVPNITSSGTIVPCSGGSMTLTAPSGLTTYLWNTGATTNSINVSQSGNYFVTVTNSFGCERTSNLFPVNASNMAPPQVCIVGIDSLTNENRIVWEKPLTLGIDSFYVYKESNVSNVYTKIGATDYNDLAVFLDVNSNPAVQAYRYKISALDTCGVETNVGDFHKTIHLTINQGVGGAWNLIWSHYEGLNFGSYNIYRGTSLSNMALLTTIQSNLNSYSDLTPPTGAVYYQIEVVNPVNCDPTKILNYGVSKSNIVNNGQSGLNEDLISVFQVYPNPTNANLTLEVSHDLVGKNYFFTDFAGRIIHQGKIYSSKEQIDLQAISNGSYFLQVEEKAIQVVKQ
jgi:hypothetical protein